MTTNQKNTNNNRFSFTLLALGLVGLIVAVIAAFSGNQERFYQSYLVAFIFWLSVSLGSLAFLMVHYLTGSRWGLTVRRVNEAATGTIWLMGLFFIPLLFNLRGLYLWARPEVVQADQVLQLKSAYLNPSFFIGRAVFYFVIWIVLAWVINRLSTRWAKDGDQEAKNKLKGLSAFGLILYTFTMSFASIDWMMSISPFWTSTGYGLIVIFAQMLSSLAFAILVVNLVPDLGLGRSWDLKTTPIPYKDLGALLLTFVMSWAYLAYFQLLIIWAGNIPEEVVWYTERIEGGWLTVGVLVAVLLFALPFVVLISMRVRHNMRILAWLGALIMVVSLVDVYWLIIPSFYPGHFNLSWLDVVIPIGMGGVWLSVFLLNLKKRPALREAEQQSLQPRVNHENKPVIQEQ